MGLRKLALRGADGSSVSIGYDAASLELLERSASDRRACLAELGPRLTAGWQNQQILMMKSTGGHRGKIMPNGRAQNRSYRHGRILCVGRATG
jgi:hypothetical protein